MGKIYKLGEGGFRGVQDKKHLEKLGYISGKKANEVILEYLCDNSYENGGLEKYQKYTKKLSDILDKVQVGDGKSTRFYYRESEVIAFIQSILNGDEEILILTQKTEDLKAQGYISGVVVGDTIYRVLKELCMREKNKDKELNSWYKVEFKNLQNVVEHKTVGTGKATRHYYLRSEVQKYIHENIIDIYK